MSQGARRLASRYSLGRATVPVLVAMAAVGGDQRRHPGRHAGALVRGEQQRRACRAPSGNLKYLWPATVTSVEIGVGGGGTGAPVRAPGRGRGRPLPRAGGDGAGAHHVPLLRAAGPRRRDRARVPGEPLVALLSTAASRCSCSPRRCCSRRSPSWRCARSFGQLEPVAGGVGAVARLRWPLASFWRVTLPLVRPGLVAALVLVFAFTLGDLSTTQVLLPAESVHARHRVLREQLDGGVRRGGAVRRGPDRARAGLPRTC